MSHTPIKVLYCILDNRFGGPHRLAQTAGRQLRARGIDMLFLTGRKTGETWQPEDATVFALQHIQCFQRRRPLVNLIRFLCWLPHNVFRIRRLIRTCGVTIVHIDGVTNFVPALAARWTGTPIVWLYNDHLPGPLRRLLLPLVTALATVVLVQGEQLKELRTGASPRLHSKTSVLYSSVDTRLFDAARYTASQREQLRRDLGLPPDGVVIGMIGNLNQFKGHTYFLQAARRIKERMPRVMFLIVGRKLDTDPGYWDHLQRLTAQLGLEQDVLYTGFRDDIPALLATFDLFVLASLRESCPVALLEAMAMRVPVVATDVGAVREMVTDGQTGFVVPPGDADALAQAALAYLAQPRPQVRAMVEAARKRVEQDFTVESIARQQGQLYERLARRPSDE